MPSIELLLAFLAAAALFAYVPGPSMMYATAQTIARGRRGGLMAALGLHTGGYLHVIAAALGLAVLFETVPLVYAGLKLIGAAYLVVLGLRWLLSREGIVATSTTDARSPEKRAFWQSVTVEIFNPKTAIFYVAFLPQFTDPAAALPLWAQLVVLGTVVNVMFSSADLVCIFLAAKITAWFRDSARASNLTRRIGGGMLVALGTNLALSDD